MDLDQDLQPIDWQKIKRAIYTWANDLLGVDVIWENENIPQPPYPYVSLNIISGPIKEGGFDELRTSVDLTRPAGEEIEMLTTDQVRFTLSLIAHINNDAFVERPECDSLILISKLQSSLGRRQIIDFFDHVCCSVISWEPPIDVSIPINGEWLRRVNMDIVFRTVTIVTERTGYIDKAQIISDTLDVDFVVDAS
jgi:hypothetical protein